jgi:hypothetical protein
MRVGVRFGRQGVTSLGAPVVRSCRGFEKLYGFKRIFVERARNVIRLGKKNSLSQSSSFVRFEPTTNDSLCLVVVVAVVLFRLGRSLSKRGL